MRLDGQRLAPAKWSNTATALGDGSAHVRQGVDRRRARSRCRPASSARAKSRSASSWATSSSEISRSAGRARRCAGRGGELRGDRLERGHQLVPRPSPRRRHSASAVPSDSGSGSVAKPARSRRARGLLGPPLEGRRGRASWRRARSSSSCSAMPSEQRLAQDLALVGLDPELIDRVVGREDRVLRGRRCRCRCRCRSCGTTPNRPAGPAAARRGASVVSRRSRWRPC